jgi:hypothetical protein
MPLFTSRGLVGRKGAGGRQVGVTASNLNVTSYWKSLLPSGKNLSFCVGYTEGRGES